MSEEDEFEKIFAELRTLRDQIRVQLHLAKAEIRDEWEEELEPKFEEAERKLEETAEDTRQAVNVIAEELMEAYRRIKSRL